MIGKKTQRQFAETIGISADLLKKIENRERGLTDRVARRIQRATGVHSRLLMVGKLRPAWGNTYSKDFYDQWRAISPQNDEIAKERALQLVPWMDILFRAATRMNRLWPVFYRIIEALNDCREDFNLTTSIDKVLEDHRGDYQLPEDKYQGALSWEPSPNSSLQSSWLSRYRTVWIKDAADALGMTPAALEKRVREQITKRIKQRKTKRRTQRPSYHRAPA
jgi:transcriptional regulator with XRE-family HTH domain